MAHAAETLFSAILDGANRTAIASLKQRFAAEAIDLSLYRQVARPIYEGAVDRVMAEWAKLAEAVIPEDGLRAFLNAQAAELGVEVAAAYREEYAWQTWEWDD